MLFKSTIMLKNKILFIAFAFLQTHLASGQLLKKTSDSYSTVGIGGGSSHYFGDLSPYRTFYYGIYSNVRWNGTINYQVQLNPKFSARAAFTYARIFGNDATYGGKLADSKPAVQNQRLRNLHFRNDMMEFTAMGLYSFKPLDLRKRKGDPLSWSPYVGLGIGIASNNPKARGNILHNGALQSEIRDWESLRAMNNEIPVKSYSAVVPVIPLSLGLKTLITPNLILGIEGSLRFTFSDYLDDVSKGNYSNGSLSYRADEDYFALTGKPRTASFMKAANLDPNVTLSPSMYADQVESRTGVRGSGKPDMYILTQITLNYIISSRVKCPPIGQ